MWLRFVLIKPIGLHMAYGPKYNVKSTGAENAPGHGPFIIVANHQTVVDVFAIGLEIRKTTSRTRIIPWGKVEIGKAKEGFLGWLLWNWLGTISIARGTEGEMLEAIRLSLEHLRQGKIIFVHPEGTRYSYGELGPFKYGLANLARAAPAPILPVGIWRRRDDGGIQVNVGKPFFMPPRKMRYEVLEEAEEKAEESFYRQVETLKQWSASLPQDKKGMKLIAGIIDSVVEGIYRQNLSFDRFCRQAEAEDNEFLRDKVLELLPPDFRKVEEREFSSRGR